MTVRWSSKGNTKQSQESTPLACQLVGSMSSSSWKLPLTGCDCWKALQLTDWRLPRYSQMGQFTRQHHKCEYGLAILLLTMLYPFVISDEPILWIILSWTIMDARHHISRSLLCQKNFPILRSWLDCFCIMPYVVYYHQFPFRVTTVLCSKDKTMTSYLSSRLELFARYVLMLKVPW